MANERSGGLLEPSLSFSVTGFISEPFGEHEGLFMNLKNDKDEIAIFISAAGFLLSCASFITSVYIAKRDRGRLIAKSTFIPKQDSYTADVLIEIVNKGRRPMTIISLCWKAKDGTWHGKALGEYVLPETARLPVLISNIEDIVYDSATGWFPSDLYFNDSFGNYHKVKHSQRNLRQLFITEKYKPKAPIVGIISTS